MDGCSGYGTINVNHTPRRDDRDRPPTRLLPICADPFQWWDGCNGRPGSLATDDWDVERNLLFQTRIFGLSRVCCCFCISCLDGSDGPLRYDGGVAGHRLRWCSRMLLLTSLSCTGLDLGDLNPLLRILCDFDVVVTWTPAATVSVPLDGCMESAGRPRPYFFRDFRGLVHSGCGTIRLRLLAHACIAGRPFSGISWG